MDVPKDSPLRDLKAKEYITLLDMLSKKNPRNIKEKRITAEIANRLAIRFEQCGFKPYITWYVLQANIAASLGDIDLMDRIFDEIEARGFSKPLFYDRIKTEALANALMVEEAVESYFKTKNAKPSLVSKIIEAYSNKGDYKGADSFWERVKNLDSRIDRGSYDCYIDSLFARGDVELAEKTLELKRTEGFEANIASHNMVLKGYLKNDKWDKMIAYFRDLSESGIVLNVGTYNYIMSAYIKKKDNANALRTYFLLLKAGVSGNDWTLGLVSEALLEPKDGVYLSNVIKDAGGFLSVTLCRTIMIGYLVNARKFRGKITKSEDALKAATDLSSEATKVAAESEEEDVSLPQTRVTQEELEAMKLELKKFSSSAKTLFNHYRALCSIDPRFFHHPYLYSGYMEILSFTSSDREEVESLIKSVDSVSFNGEVKIQGFYLSALFFAAQHKDSSLAEAIMTQALKHNIPITNNMMNNYLFSILPKENESFVMPAAQLNTCRVFAEGAKEDEVPLRKFKVLAWFLSRVAGVAEDSGLPYLQVYRTALAKMKNPDFTFSV
jgi:pentatricopeptide repeat protein